VLSGDDVDFYAKRGPSLIYLGKLTAGVPMRGEEEKQSTMFAVVSPSSIVPDDHPLRQIKERADAALKEMSALFDEMYAAAGRASIPPETLLKSQLLIALYSVPSERQLCEQLRYNFLFRWFLDMDMTSPPFDATTFGKNRERLLKHEACKVFFTKVVDQAQAAGLLSREHFSVDGSLIEAWASMKSFVPKDGSDDGPKGTGGKGGKSRIKKRKDRNAWKDFSGTRRSNETHASTTDPEARLARKGNGQESRLCFSLHALMENRHGLLRDFRIELATGTAERDVAEEMLRDLPGSYRVTVGGDKGYDTKDFVAACKDIGATPHVAQNENARRSSAIDERTTRHIGYSLSLRARMFIESIFGWAKTKGGLRRTRFKGRRRTQMYAHMSGAAYNLLRMSKLAPV
jgi:transposase